MKNRYIYLCFLSVFGMGLGASSSFAASNSDFFCSEMPQAQPAYYGLAIKNCGDKSETLEGVCTQTVFCAYVSDDIKKAAKKELQKDFSVLTDAEKKKFIKENSSADWFPTILTCQGTMTGLVAICPSPEQCKGDVFYKIQPAFIAPGKFQEIHQRQIRGNSQIFQGSTAGVGK